MSRPYRESEHPRNQSGQWEGVGSQLHGTDDLEPVSSVMDSRDECRRMAKRRVIDLMWHTAGIEVQGLTFPETEQVFHGTVPYSMARNKVMVVNNIKHAWRFLLDNIDWPVDKAYASEYNRLIGDGIEPDPGMIRTIPVGISGTDYKPPIPDDGLIAESIARANALPDPEDRALTLFCQCSRGQWFSNGNKRTSTMLANHSLIHDGRGVFAIPVDQVETAFKDRLLDYYESGDATELKQWLSMNAIHRLGETASPAE